VTRLDGYTVVVTRPAAQAARFAEGLESLGARVLSFPTLEIECLDLGPAGRGALAPDRYDWTLYTSTNAVECSLAQLPRPAGTRVAAIGRATARALEEHGITVHARPDGPSDSEHLLALAAFADVAGLRILIVKGTGGRTHLREELTRRGATVAQAEVYRRRTPRPDPNALAGLETACRDARLVVTATSVDGLEGLLGLLSEPRFARLRDLPLVVPGERVAQGARDRGWRGRLIVSPSAEDDAMLDALRCAAGPGGPLAPA
jgi:uroporphyrinogen-III synthase